MLFALLMFGALPALAASPAVSDAPGRGELPDLTPHYTQAPAVYPGFDKQAAERISDSIQRRFIMGTNSMVIRWDLKAGVHLPVHVHPNEQISWVQKGRIDAYSQGKRYALQEGDMMVFAPNVPHEFVTSADSVLVEYVTPLRQDFINGGWSGIALPPAAHNPKPYGVPPRAAKP
jgi:quercetin dioxygenase-like cupin family protein